MGMNFLYFILVLLASGAITSIALVPTAEVIFLPIIILVKKRINRNKNTWLMILIDSPVATLVSYLYVLGNATVLYFTIETFSALWVKILLALLSAVFFYRLILHRMLLQIKSYEEKSYSDEIYDYYDFYKMTISAVIITTIIIFIWPDALNAVFKWPYIISRSFW